MEGMLVWIKYLPGPGLLDITTQSFLSSNHSIWEGQSPPLSPAWTSPHFLRSDSSSDKPCKFWQIKIIVWWGDIPNPHHKHGKWQSWVGGNRAASSILKGVFPYCAAEQVRSSSLCHLLDAHAFEMSFQAGNLLGTMLSPGSRLGTGWIRLWYWKKQMNFGASWSYWWRGSDVLFG